MAELMFDLFREIIKKNVDNPSIQDKMYREFREAASDSGLAENVNNWRDAFYGMRMPKRMTHTTVNIQMQNLEQEVLLLREKNYLDGVTRKMRTLNGFEIEKNSKGHTVLKPTTHLSKLILANTQREDLCLSGLPSQSFEKLCRDLEIAKKDNEILAKALTDARKTLSGIEDSHTEIRALESILQSERQLRKKMQSQRDEAQCLLLGLCNRFGLQCDIDNSRGTITAPDNSKRKGRKNRRVPILSYTFGEFDQPIHSDNESVELPN